MLILDSIETCLSLEPLRAELPKLGLHSEDLELWFARSLRDAFARESADAFEPFKTVLETSLDTLLRSRAKPAEHDAIEKVLALFAELPLREDVRPALELAKTEGIRVAVLTNGGSNPTKNAFANAGLDDFVEKFISVDDVKHFKPAPQPYLHAARELGVEPRDCTLIAAHGWDILGALRAGLAAAFVQRTEPLSEELAQKVEANGMMLDGVVRQLLAREQRHRRSA